MNPGVSCHAGHPDTIAQIAATVTVAKKTNMMKNKMSPDRLLVTSMARPARSDVPHLGHTVPRYMGVPHLKQGSIFTVLPF
jgi:hypothetical protein